eukprot:3426327-Prymnesium_polylepis.1
MKYAITMRVRACARGTEGGGGRRGTKGEWASDAGAERACVAIRACVRHCARAAARRGRVRCGDALCRLEGWCAAFKVWRAGGSGCAASKVWRGLEGVGVSGCAAGIGVGTWMFCSAMFSIHVPPSILGSVRKCATGWSVWNVIPLKVDWKAEVTSSMRTDVCTCQPRVARRVSSRATKDRCGE